MMPNALREQLFHGDVRLKSARTTGWLAQKNRFYAFGFNGVSVVAN